MELKPCPFCGGEAKLRETEVANMTFYVVRCGNKFCQVNPTTNHRRMRPDAIEAWNRRAEPNMVEIDQFSRVGEGEKE